MSIVKGTKEFNKTPTVNGADVLTTGNVLDDLSNVSVAAPATGDRLEWNGSAWVPITPVAGVEFDTQSVGTATQTNTTSSTWVDLANLTITTSNTQAMDYMIFASLSGLGSVTALMSMRLMADGVEVPNTVARFEVSPGNTNKVMMIQTEGLVNLATAKIIKVQYQTSAGTFTINERRLMVRGAK